MFSAPKLVISRQSSSWKVGSWNNDLRHGFSANLVWILCRNTFRDTRFAGQISVPESGTEFGPAFCCPYYILNRILKIDARNVVQILALKSVPQIGSPETYFWSFAVMKSVPQICAPGTYFPGRALPRKSQLRYEKHGLGRGCNTLITNATIHCEIDCMGRL